MPTTPEEEAAAKARQEVTGAIANTSSANMGSLIDAAKSSLEKREKNKADKEARAAEAGKKEGQPSG
ncbi:hypothetical protein B0T24DRAFT_683454 [Lasiosphaeria ovina]|uniref:Uncharacterized protein n=1 Tax=Lasiosphaeria ovina TaxID=92902 RepID=A0AAE0MZM9_9PEZI|nr:hypothetical protein B0T24DRAFT_683454 [Lasiosphaeria ovina]